MLFVDTNLKIFVKKFASILLHTTKRKKTSKKTPEPLFLMARFLDGMHLLNRVSSNRMREEADYPASFCVWDQDQEANPPFGDRQRGVPSQDRSGEGRKKNQWANWTPWEKLCCITVQTRRFAPLSLDYVRVIALPLMASKSVLVLSDQQVLGIKPSIWLSVFCFDNPHLPFVTEKKPG